MITHVPLFAHPAPNKVLIIGGGDCGALTEVMKHPEVRECVMCEIDEKVVEVSRRHFPEHTRGLDDPRAKMMFQDGKKFIEETDEKFDIIILDLSDPIGPTTDLFQREFHLAVYDRLTDNGIMVAQVATEVIRRAKAHGKAITRANLYAELNAMHGKNAYDPKTTVGPVTYSPTDHMGVDEMQIYVVKNGVFKAVGKPFKATFASK